MRILILIVALQAALNRFLPLACGTNDNQLSTISVRLRTQDLRFFRRQNTFIVLRSASLLHCSNHNQIGIADFFRKEEQAPQSHAWRRRRARRGGRLCFGSERGTGR